MESSGFESSTRLYRKAVVVVILVLAAASAGVRAFAQYAKKRPVSKGPRALGLLEVAENGKAHLIPVAIMIDGRFYDAGAYKANPVPMALQYETVYEGIKSGISQGLFTVSGTMHGPGSWVADGKWRTSAEIQADKDRAKALSAKKNQKAPEEASGPPKLRRAPNSNDDGSSKPETGAPRPASSRPGSQSPGGTSSNPPASTPSSTHGGGSSDAPGGAGASSAPLDAPDRPILRREPPSETPREQTKADTSFAALKGPIKLVPAISDAAGPEARPYAYAMKPEEEQNFEKKMLAMAEEEVKQRAGHLMAESAPVTPESRKRTTPQSAKRNMHQPPAAAPEFRDVEMRVFDLTNSNEPVLVLTASAVIPNARLNLQYSTALIAREDIYGELHKVFAQTTDNEHLDALAKYEFIDAVDADGDGRGELLFRTTSDGGSAFSIYAVIGDRLWPLFEGKPGS
ncbi:MAG: hypothetical protein J2P13_00355 [Acidobacteria bacterium]|nr:hypothetical protein [Acidobacteriota bacterium]